MAPSTASCNDGTATGIAAYTARTAMVVRREKWGNRRTNTATTARTATVAPITAPSRIHRPEPAARSGTRKARLASATNVSDGSIRGSTWWTKPWPSIIEGVPRRTNQRSVWRS